jgi:hypothetical protein
MQLSFKVDPKVLKGVENYIKGEVARITESVGLKTYNSIVMGEYPYWSGSYVTSWNLSVGAPKFSINEPAGKNEYPRPDESYYLINRKGNEYNVQFGQIVYLTNATPHAMQVEYEGTPTHDGGWYIAHEAVNQTVLSYKFNMN